VSNTRKARGIRMPETNPYWSQDTLDRPLAVRGVYPLRSSPPVVWVDATGRPNVGDLMRAHPDTTGGEVFTQWCRRLTPNLEMRLLLLVRFKRPVRTEFALAFEPGHLGTLMNAALAGAVTIVTHEPRFERATLTAGKCLKVEVDTHGLQEALESEPQFQILAAAMRAAQ